VSEGPRFFSGRWHVGRYDRGYHEQELFEGQPGLTKTVLTEMNA
jgi:hypothetical protein